MNQRRVPRSDWTMDTRRRSEDIREQVRALLFQGMNSAQIRAATGLKWETIDRHVTAIGWDVQPRVKVAESCAPMCKHGCGRPAAPRRRECGTCRRERHRAEERRRFKGLEVLILCQPLYTNCLTVSTRCR